MPRLARKDLNTCFLHVMVQGVNKEYIFNKSENIDKYLSIVNKNKNDYDFTIIAYCIMNNHAHFLIYTENIEDFGKFMQKTNLQFATAYNKENNRCGVLFRNRYRTEGIYNEEYLINCIKYIHENPVKAGMVSKCGEYKHSSYNDYINNCGAAKSSIMIQIFGKDCNYKDLFYEVNSRRYIDIEDETEEEKKEYILNGIKEFNKINSSTIIDIFSHREVFKKLIKFLKEQWNIKYVETMNYFEIPIGVMNSLKRN